MDDPNITIEEYIRLEKEKARKCGKVFNWETAKYGKICPQHIDEFNLKDETSFSKCDKEEQNILNFIDLFPFNVIYPNDSKSDKDNDDDKVDIEHSLGDLSVKQLPDIINTNVGAYAHGSNRLLETKPRENNIDEYWWRIYKSGNLEVLESRNLKAAVQHMNSCSINLHGESIEQISGEFLILILFNSRI
ncbi:hypothetical protein Tco_0209418 [Tanacetum coccineum]